MEKRCPKGTHRCFTGECVVPTKEKTGRCPKGTRKCVDGKCYPYIETSKNRSSLKSSRSTTRSRPKSLSEAKADSPVPKTDLSLDQQVEDYNEYQSIYKLTANGKDVFFHTKDGNIQCSNIEILTPDHIYLDYLERCGSKSGRKVIETIEDFARRYGYKTIELEDDSRIVSHKTRFRVQGGECSFWLPILQILAYGETWYNRMGYKSKFYDEEISHNKKIISMKYRKFISEINKFSDYFTEAPEKYLSLEKLFNIGVRMSGKKEPTVQEVFSEVIKKIKGYELKCDGTIEEIEWLMDIINFIVDWGGAIQDDMRKAKNFNIIYLRGNKTITQFKTL